MGVLRALLAPEGHVFKDTHMAELLGCSKFTVHSLESGRLDLSDEMAAKIVHETGISQSWLLGGNPKAPAVTDSGEPYSRATFDRIRFQHAEGKEPSDVLFPFNQDLAFCGELLAILARARKHAKFGLASFKVRRFLKTLREEFGQDAARPPHMSFGRNRKAATLPFHQLSHLEAFTDAMDRHEELYDQVFACGLGCFMAIPPQPKPKRQSRAKK